jgi:molybdopterin converting factor small subunit
MVKLVFLGKFRGLTRENLAADIPSGIGTLADLKRWIEGTEPTLGRAMADSRTQIVLNHEIVRDMALGLMDGDEVAFLPPMSGG